MSGRRKLAAGLGALAFIILAALAVFGAPGGSDAIAIAARAGVIVLFAALAFAAVLLARKPNSIEVDSDPDARLLGDDTVARLGGLTEEAKRRAVIASVKTLEEQIRSALLQARAAARSDDLALYWRPEPEGPLKLRACLSELPPAVEVIPGRGVLGLAVENGDPIRVNGARSMQNAVPHAAGPVEALLAVPVFNRQSLLGLIVATRGRPEPFGPDEEKLLAGLGDQVLEFHRHARLLRRTEEERARFKSLADLSHRLSCTLDRNEIIHSIVRAGFALTGGAAVVVVLGDHEDDLALHLGSEDEGHPPPKVELDNTLIGLALREHRRLYIPDMQSRERPTPILGRKLDPTGVRSLLIQPLALRDGRGAIVFTSTDPDAFSTEALDAAAVLSDLASVSLHNSVLYCRMEEKAIRDGLTGLYNHRWLQERLADEIERAERLRTRVAFVLSDIDHFKKVNDTYGHPAGDEVLRAVSRVLAASVRKTDAAARYGGEEFGLVLLGADAKGAAELAERARREIAKLSFRAGGKDFRVTISLGIAVYPDHARDRAALIKRADEALYKAKESGRNRTMVSGT